MCESRRSDHFYQVRGPESGAPACDAGEPGATPGHLTNVTEDKLAESPACRAGDSGGSTRRSRQFLSVVQKARTRVREARNLGATPGGGTNFREISSVQSEQLSYTQKRAGAKPASPTILLLGRLISKPAAC